MPTPGTPRVPMQVKTLLFVTGNILWPIEATHKHNPDTIKHRQTEVGLYADSYIKRQTEPFNHKRIYYKAISLT